MKITAKDLYSKLLENSKEHLFYETRTKEIFYNRMRDVLKAILVDKVMGDRIDIALKIYENLQRLKLQLRDTTF